MNVEESIEKSSNQTQKNDYEKYLERRYEMNYKLLDKTYFKQNTQLHF